MGDLRVEADPGEEISVRLDAAPQALQPQVPVGVDGHDEPVDGDVFALVHEC